MGIKFWLEGTGPRPEWVGDDEDTGAAIRVDRALITRIRNALTKMFSCLHRPATTSDAPNEAP